MIFFLSTNLYSTGRLFTQSDPLSGRLILCFVDPEKRRKGNVGGGYGGQERR